MSTKRYPKKGRRVRLLQDAYAQIVCNHPKGIGCSVTFHAGTTGVVHNCFMGPMGPVCVVNIECWADGKEFTIQVNPDMAFVGPARRLG